jgi:hypothetical protein
MNDKYTKYIKTLLGQRKVSVDVSSIDFKNNTATYIEQEEAETPDHFAIQIRDIHTAIHNLIIFNDRNKAIEQYKELMRLLGTEEAAGEEAKERTQEMQEFWNNAGAVDQIEINYRNVFERIEGNIIKLFYEDAKYGLVEIVNPKGQAVPDVF